MRNWASLALALGAAAGASGCVLPAKMTGTSAMTVDPNSTVAKEVVYASRHPGPYPKFSDIPQIPTDVRPPSEWRSAVLDLKQRRDQLQSDVAALPPPQTGTEALGTELRSKLPSDAEAPNETSPDESAAYGRALRERATPPPPPR